MSADEDPVRIKVLEINQPIGTFYVGIMSAKDLVDISHFDYRALARINGFDGKDTFAEYMGIQRPLNSMRVNEIKDYVKTIDASFPNAIILALKSDDADFEKEGIMKIKRKQNVATIIDGQHRLAGFVNNPVDNFQLIVTIFLDLELEEQAYLFATINLKHVKINPSLAKDLVEFSTIEIPEKLAHNIAKKFNLDKNSPWHRQIKMLGRKDELSKGLITQHTFTKEIIGLIYNEKHHYDIRDILKRKSNKRNHLKKFDNIFEKYPLWCLYRRGNDATIYEALFNYFSAVKDTFPKEWNNPKYILTKTTGYSAIMQGLAKIIPIGLKKKDISYKFFKEYIIKSKNNLKKIDKKLTREYFPPGKVGESELFKTMFKDIP